jgi:hypothetical protein
LQRRRAIICFPFSVISEPLQSSGPFDVDPSLQRRHLTPFLVETGYPSQLQDIGHPNAIISALAGRQHTLKATTAETIHLSSDPQSHPEPLFDCNDSV